MVLAFGGRDGTVVRALTSQHYGLGLIPAIYNLCRLSLLLALIPVPRVFLQVLSFPPSSKTNTTKFQIQPSRATLIHLELAWC